MPGRISPLSENGLPRSGSASATRPSRKASPDGGAGDDHAVFDDWRHDDDFKIGAPADFLEQLYVATLAVSEAKVFADQYGFGAQGVH